MAIRFMDTNVLLRYLTRDDEDKAKRALALLTRVERGEETIVMSVMVVFETIFTLQHSYAVPRQHIRDMMLDMLSLRGLRVPERALCEAALNTFVEKNVSFADAFNAAFMQDQGVSEIYSWDADFDRLPGLRRIDPA